MDPVTQGMFTWDNFFLILFGLFLLGTIVLDVAMVVSLARPGDERRQMIVWKASTYTLLGTAGSLCLSIVEKLVRMEPMAVNPFVTLGAAAIIYFLFLLYFRHKHGG